MNDQGIDSPIIARADEIDMLVADYLRGAGGDPYRALRQAATDVLREVIDAHLATLELKRAASHGYLRQPPVQCAA